ncbi:hypothetical protein [Ewingella americana]
MFMRLRFVATDCSERPVMEIISLSEWVVKWLISFCDQSLFGLTIISLMPKYSALVLIEHLHLPSFIESSAAVYWLADLTKKSKSDLLHCLRAMITSLIFNHAAPGHLVRQFDMEHMGLPTQATR